MSKWAWVEEREQFMAYSLFEGETYEADGKRKSSCDQRSLSSRYGKEGDRYNRGYILPITKTATLQGQPPISISSKPILSTITTYTSHHHIARASHPLHLLAYALMLEGHVSHGNCREIDLQKPKTYSATAASTACAIPAASTAFTFARSHV